MHSTIWHMCACKHICVVRHICVVGRTPQIQGKLLTPWLEWCFRSCCSFDSQATFWQVSKDIWGCCVYQQGNGSGDEAEGMASRGHYTLAFWKFPLWLSPHLLPLLRCGGGRNVKLCMFGKSDFTVVLNSPYFKIFLGLKKELSKRACCIHIGTQFEIPGPMWDQEAAKHASTIWVWGGAKTTIIDQ